MGCQPSLRGWLMGLGGFGAFVMLGITGLGAGSKLFGETSTIR
jgi:hypothetical protein